MLIKGKEPNPVVGAKGWINDALVRGSIRQKIGAGYALAVGIAILGTTAGLVIGEHYQRQALAQLSYIHRQEHLLHELQTSVLQSRTHASRFAVVLGNPTWLHYETQGFKQSINQAKQVLQEIERFTQASSHRTHADPKPLQDLLKTTEITLNAYASVTQSLLNTIDPWHLPPDQIVPAQQQLLRNSSGEVAIALDRLDWQLNQQIEAVQREDHQAFVAFERAATWRVQIIVASMLLSVAIAITLAMYTSQAIVQPLHRVTRIAQQVAEESNFTLKAPITTNDEVGVLATSLNQLIQRIAIYTQELKQAEAQLIHTEKMSSLGVMVAGVAHEINNPVNFIYGNLNYIRDYTLDLLTLLRLYQHYYPDPLPAIQDQLESIDFNFLAEDLPKLLASMKVGAERIREIVLSLRNFSRHDEAQIKSVDLHEGIDNTLIVLNSRLKRGIRVIKQYGELPLVECSPAQLNQVFMNVLSNAIDAIESHFANTIWGRRTDTPPECPLLNWEFETGDISQEICPMSNSQNHVPIPTIQICTEVLDADWVVIKMTDNGAGIPTAIKDQIFDPFFTTKEPGKGTGLGLTISYQIISQHQGKIEVKSTLGVGTEFIITLPVRETKPQTSHPSESLLYCVLP